MTVGKTYHKQYTFHRLSTPNTASLADNLA